MILGEAKIKTVAVCKKADVYRALQNSLKWSHQGLLNHPVSLLAGMKCVLVSFFKNLVTSYEKKRVCCRNCYICFREGGRI
jgi:hypothetical protein